MRLIAILALAPLLPACSTVPRDLLSQPNTVQNVRTGKATVVKARQGQRSAKRVPRPQTAVKPKPAPAAAAAPAKRKGIFRRTWDRVRGQ